jgi:ECF transporter S component (folate family)
LKPKKIKTVDIIIIAFLIAIEIVLTRFGSIETPMFRIGFGFLPLAFIGILYGPVWGGICGALGDVMGMFIFPKFAYFPGFTLTAFLTGAVYGAVLHNKPITWKRTFLSALIVCGILNLVLDTYWIYIMYGQALLAMLPGRLMRTAVMIPLQTFLIHFVWKRCEPTFSKVTNRNAVTRPFE